MINKIITEKVINMNIGIGSYTFEGPFASTGKLKNCSGVYVILGTKSGKRYVVDVGESKNVKERVENHDRANCWARQGYTEPLEVAVLYVDEAKRMRVERELRQQYKPPCGER